MGLTDFINRQPSSKILWLTIFVQIITVIILLVTILTKHESFRPHRGVYFPEGKMIAADVPETVTIDGQEVKNPLWLSINDRWNKTDQTWNGYPIWAPK